MFLIERFQSEKDIQNEYKNQKMTKNKSLKLVEPLALEAFE